MEGDGLAKNDMKIFYAIRQFVKRRINNNENEFVGDSYNSEKGEVSELIRRSVETGESNSAIICGPPGCGKSAVITSYPFNYSANFFLDGKQRFKKPLCVRRID